MGQASGRTRPEREYSRKAQPEKVQPKKKPLTKEEQIRRKKQLKRKRRRRARRRFFIKLSLLLLGCCTLLVLGNLAWKITVGDSNWTLEKKEEKVDVDKLAEEGYPDSLLELLEKNPETKQFVLDYMENKDKHEAIDVSKDIQPNEIPLFLQWDERWGYETYGDDFLALTGCGPTCLSMVRCGLSGDGTWNPYKVASMAEEEGLYVPGSGSSWELMTRGAEKLGLISWEVIFDEEHIVSTLQSGNPIICVVGPGDFTDNGHFLVLTGVDDSGKIILRDPNSNIRSEKAWDIRTLMSQIKNLWAFSY